MVPGVEHIIILLIVYNPVCVFLYPNHFCNHLFSHLAPVPHPAVFHSLAGLEKVWFCQLYTWLINISLSATIAQCPR